jgi:AcrR family transcriptional regulator
MSGTAQRSPRVLPYEAVVAGARRHFAQRATIAMDDLAVELGISRATLYRLVEGRDRLLGDVIWSFTEPFLDEIVERHLGGAGRGADADVLVRISLDFAEGLQRPGAFRRFLESDPDTALRVLLTPAGGCHERAVAAQRRILERARDELGVPLGADLDVLAYLYVRIIESLLYADLIIGRPAEPALIARAARAILTSG